MKPRMARKPKIATTPKPVPYVLIPRDTDVGRPMYELLFAIIDEHHEELSRSNVRVALAWATAWKADADGRLTLGKCKRATDLDRELAPFDFAILLNRDFWLNPRVTNVQREALLDHELMHAAVAYDENGEPKVDERGRTVYRMRKHDLEEFSDIVRRHGLWKADLEDFASALDRARANAGQHWVGYTSLREKLLAAGVDVPIDAVRLWTDAERRDAEAWAVLCKELSTLQTQRGSSMGRGSSMELVCPPHVTAAATTTVESREPHAGTVQ